MNKEFFETLKTHQLALLYEGASEKIIKILEPIFLSRVLSNDAFPIEYLYKSAPISIEFIPASESYKLFGKYLIVDLIFDETDILRISSNLSHDPLKYSHGMVKAKILVNTNLTVEQKERLEKIGFNSRDVLRIN